MEKLLREEIRHDYERTISEKDNEFQKLKEGFEGYKYELNNEIKEEVAKEISTLDRKVKGMIKKNENEINSQAWTAP